MKRKSIFDGISKEEQKALGEAISAQMGAPAKKKGVAVKKPSQKSKKK